MNRSRNRAGEGGYTLLELLIVLLLLGFAFALVMPAVNRLYQHYELDLAAREVTAEIRSAQSAAVSRQVMQEIRFNRFAPTFTRWEDGRFLEQTRLPTPVAYRNGYLDHAVSQLRFYPLGTVSGSGNIQLVNRVREQADILVQVSSGHVQYEGVHPR